MSEINKVVAVMVVAVMLLVPLSAAAMSFIGSDADSVTPSDGDLVCNEKTDLSSYLIQDNDKRIVLCTNQVISSTVVVKGNHVIVSTGDYSVERDVGFTKVMFKINSGRSLVIGGEDNAGGVITVDGQVNNSDSTIGYATDTMILVDKGTLTLNADAKLINNENHSTISSSYNGGAVRVLSGTLNINGAELSNNSALNAGAIRLEMNQLGTPSKCIMNSGKIYDNSTYGNMSNMGNGSAIVVSSSEFIMNGGEIYDNNANSGSSKTSGNGAVYLFIGKDGYDSTFKMTGGSIYDNTATTNGSAGYCGGVYLKGNTKDSSYFIMSGGSISTSNGVKDVGSSVYVGDNGVFTLQKEGDKQIIIGSDVFISNSSINIGDDVDASIKSVTYSLTNAGQVTYDDIKITDGKLENNEASIAFIKASGDISCIYYISNAGDDNNDGSLSNPAKTINGVLDIVSKSVPEGKKAYVTIVILNTISVEDLTLDVTIMSKVASLTFERNTNMRDTMFLVSGDFVLNNVSINGMGIYGSNSAVKVVGTSSKTASFTMKGTSSIINNVNKTTNVTFGGAVFVGEHASFEMYDSSLISNCISSYGGAVRIQGDSAIFTMMDGKIQYCEGIKGNAGAISVRDGTFIMNGGTISNNKVAVLDSSIDTGRGSAVQILCNESSSSTFIMNGGKIENNTTDGTDNDAQVSANISGGTIYVTIGDEAIISDKQMFVYAFSKNGTSDITIGSGQTDFTVVTYDNKLTEKIVSHKITFENSRDEVGNVLVKCVYNNGMKVTKTVSLVNNVAYKGIEVFDTDAEEREDKSELSQVYETRDIYVHYVPINFAITYALDGGTDNGNPVKYNIDSPDITLVDPTWAGHTFLGWTASGCETVTKDLVIAAGSTGELTFTANWSINSYNVTWMNGNVLKVDVVEYGTIPSYDGETPVKDSTDQFTYEFIGWDTTPVEVTGDVTYTAQYTETAVEYTISYAVNGTVVKTETYGFGDDIVPYNYTRSGYIVSAWNGEVPEIMPAENLVFTATANRIYVPVPTPVEPEIIKATVSNVVSESIIDAASNIEGNKVFIGVTEGVLSEDTAVIDAGTDYVGKTLTQYVYQDGQLVETGKTAVVNDDGKMTVEIRSSTEYVYVYQAASLNVVGGEINVTLIAVAGVIALFMSIGVVILRKRF